MGKVMSPGQLKAHTIERENYNSNKTYLFYPPRNTTSFSRMVSV